MDARPKLGRSGEEAVARLYQRRGFHVLARNQRFGRSGEIDLIVRRGSLIAFCEVKTRGSDRWGAPAEAVAYAKQARLRRLAAAWLSENRPGPVDIRFDVASVIVRDGRTEISLLPDAF